MWFIKTWIFVCKNKYLIDHNQLKVILNIRLYLLCCLACIADFIFHELNLVHYNKLWRLIMWISAFIYCCYKPKIKILNRNLVPKTFSTLLTEKTCPGCLCRHHWKKYWGNQVEQADHSHSLLMIISLWGLW